MSDIRLHGPYCLLWVLEEDTSFSYIDGKIHNIDKLCSLFRISAQSESESEPELL